MSPTFAWASCGRCAASCLPMVRQTALATGRGGRCRNDSAGTAGQGWRGTARTQCGSWKVGCRHRNPSTTSSPFISVCPAAAGIARLVHAAAGHAEQQVRGVGRVDDDGVQLGAVGGAVLHRAHPLAQRHVVVDAGQRLPRVAAVIAAEQALRRSAGVPAAGLVGVAGRKPEGVVNAARRAAIGGLGEGRGPTRLLPGSPQVGRAEDRGPEVTGLRCGQQGAAVARVQHQVADAVAMEVRAVHADWRGVLLAAEGVAAVGLMGSPWRELTKGRPAS
jgi:hypothetical protein